MAPVEHRIVGIETEYGVTCTSSGQRRLTPDEVSRYLFRRVVSWGRSSNVFLGNGARLYLDVGSHPEYATAECSTLREALAQDRAGERIIEGLVEDAQARVTDEEIDGTVYAFKNNTDSAGNSYGCHENYLIGRAGDFSAVAEVFLPFLISRQITCEGVSSATTRSRPIINTRDEPHSDAERYRRLHVIVGDSNMSETTTLLKVGSAHLVLRLLEAGVGIPDLTLENPIRAIREISKDPTGRTLVRLANGKKATALDIQGAYFERAAAHVERDGADDPLVPQVLDLWGRTLEAVATGNLAAVETEIDWVIKRRLIERYQVKHGIPLSDPRLQQVDLAYHDITRRRGLFYVLLRHGQVARVTGDLETFEAKSIPPQTTRAKLRGDFVRAASANRRDFTVDWVHLKLNDHSQRTVLCKDPFAAADERVERLIASMDVG